MRTDSVRSSRSGAWARVRGRSPDYKAAFISTLGSNTEYYAPYDENARRWYKKAQEKVLFFNHAIVNPPVDRNKGMEGVRDVYMHVERETDAGLIVSGAKAAYHRTRRAACVAAVTAGGSWG